MNKQPNTKLLRDNADILPSELKEKLLLLCDLIDNSKNKAISRFQLVTYLKAERIKN